MPQASPIFYSSHSIQNSSSYQVSVSCPRDGSQWYSCDSGSMFIGCCRLNPCEHGCEEGYVSSALSSMDASKYLPDLQCSPGSNFYSCRLGPQYRDWDGGEIYNWGCCKSDACNAQPTPGCPIEDIGVSTLKIPNQLDSFIKIQAPLPYGGNRSEKTSDAPPASSQTDVVAVHMSRHARTLAMSTMTLLLVLPAFLVVWIKYRKLGLDAITRLHRGKLLHKSERYVYEDLSNDPFILMIR
jgi:hypothetical protein